MNFSRAVISTVSAVAFWCAAAPAVAQRITGAVLDARSRTPVVGALVTLTRDSQSSPHRVLTDKSGRFSIPSFPGINQIAVDHIGYKAAERRVAATLDRAEYIVLELEAAPVQLAELVAESPRHCGTVRDVQAARLWYFARSALGAAVVGRPTRFQITRYTRELDPESLRVLKDSTESLIVASRHGFQSASADSLMQFGFVQNGPAGFYAFAPDPAILLSEPFVESHCFRIRREKTNSSLVGLHFFPRKGAHNSGIEGTLWLSESSGILAHIEFAYTELASEFGRERAGGRIEFDQASDGTWIIPRWHMRVPRVQTVPRSSLNRNIHAGRARRRIDRVFEFGGEIVASIDPLTTAGQQPVVSQYCTESVLAEASQLWGRPAQQLGVVTGTIRTRSGQAKLTVSVRVEVRISESIGGELIENVVALTAQSNTEGMYSFCGLPVEQTISISAEGGETQAIKTLIPNSGTRVKHIDIQVEDS